MQISDAMEVPAKQDNIIPAKITEKVNKKSDDAEQAAKVKTKKQDSVNFSSEAQSLIEQFHNAEESAEQTAESFEVMIQCLTIASRIIAGDNVPYKDQQFLQEKDPELFFKANMLRTPKEKPKDHKSVLSDDEEENNSDEISAEKLDSVMNETSSNGAEAAAEGTEASEITE